MDDDNHTGNTKDAGTDAAPLPDSKMIPAHGDSLSSFQAERNADLMTNVIEKKPNAFKRIGERIADALKKLDQPISKNERKPAEGIMPAVPDVAPSELPIDKENHSRKKTSILNLFKNIKTSSSDQKRHNVMIISLITSGAAALIIIALIAAHLTGFDVEFFGGLRYDENTVSRLESAVNAYLVQSNYVRSDEEASKLESELKAYLAYAERKFSRDSTDYILVTLYLGDLYHSVKRDDDAAYVYETAIAGTGNPVALAYFYPALCDIYKSQGNSGKELACLDAALGLPDDIELFTADSWDYIYDGLYSRRVNLKIKMKGTSNE